MQYEFNVNSDFAGSRLDKALKLLLPDVSRAALQKAIRDGGCLVDGISVLDADRKLKGGELISIAFGTEQSQIVPDPAPLEILWADNNLAVINKPANLTVHPCPSCQDTTLVHRLLAHFPQLRGQGGERPGIAHRLDKDTSGLMLVALTEQTRLALSAAFAEHKIHKEYLALVMGTPSESGECCEPVGRHPDLKIKMAVVGKNHGGRDARTSWRVLWTNGRISLLRVSIHSGRTHQIRVHMAHLGFPILGDRLYAPELARKLAPRQMLHAWQLKFLHPSTGKECHFLLPPPHDFYDTILCCQKEMQRLVITGNQGCGKSSFRRLLEKEGIPTASADAMVGSFYDSGLYAADWLRLHNCARAVEANGSINRGIMLELLAKNPEIKKEFEDYIHALVADETEIFWQRQEKAGQSMAAAEIPLFFECGWQNRFAPKPFVIGVKCDQQSRWQRIAENRGWTADKIRLLESWQWPEQKKMAACDYVVDNNGGEAELAAALADFQHFMKQKICQKQANLLEHIQSICGAHPVADCGLDKFVQ